jgi:hypothetical protein
MIWLILALACAVAGGIIAGIGRAWAVVLVALAVVFLVLPRLF